MTPWWCSNGQRARLLRALIKKTSLHSDDLSSIPAGVYNFYYLKIKEQEAGNGRRFIELIVH